MVRCTFRVVFPVGLLGLLCTHAEATPSFSPIPAVSVPAGEPLSLVVTATAPTGLVVLGIQSTELRGALFEDRMDGSGELSITPDDTHKGEYHVTFFARDEALNEVVATTTVTVVNANARPFIVDPTGPFTVVIGQDLRFDIVGQDDGQDAIQYYGRGLPSGATVTTGTGRGEFSWTPTEQQAGGWLLRLGVTDGVLSSTRSIDVSVLREEVLPPGPNHPPVFDPVDAQVASEGDVLNFTITVRDVDTRQSVTVAAAGVPPGAAFAPFDGNPASGAFSWLVPHGAADNSPYFIQITALDDGMPPLSRTLTTTITILAANNPPEIEPVAPIFARVCEEIRFALVVVDPERDDVSLFASGLGEGARFDGDSGLFVWPCPPEGSFVSTFTAVDQGNPPLSASIMVEFRVEPVQIICDFCGSECDCSGVATGGGSEHLLVALFLLLFARKLFRGWNE